MRPFKCFYDNIVFAPFIFVEDPVDLDIRPALTTENDYVVPSVANGQPVGANVNGTALLGRSSKVDPYYLIAHVRVLAL
jgi:hypothetical protein